MKNNVVNRRIIIKKKKKINKHSLVLKVGGLV